MNPEYESQCAEASKQSRLDLVEQSIGKTGYEGWSEDDLEAFVDSVPLYKNKSVQELQTLRNRLLSIKNRDDKFNKQLETVQKVLEWRKRQGSGHEFTQNYKQQQQHQRQPQGTMKQSDRMKASMPQGKAAAGRPAGLGSTQQQIDRGNILRPSLNLHSGGRIVMGRPSSADAAAAHPPRREQPQTAGRAAAAAAGGSGRAKDLQVLGGILGNGPAGQAAKQDRLVAVMEGFPVNPSVEKAKCARCHRSMMRNLLQHVDEKGELRCQGCWLKLNDTCSTAWPGETRGQAPVQQMLAQARGQSQAKASATRIGPAVRAASLRVQDGKVQNVTAMGVAKSVAAGASAAVSNAVSSILGLGRKPTGQAAAAAGGAAGTRKRSGGARDGPIELGDTDDEEDEEGGAAAVGAQAAAGPALRRSGRTTTPTNPSQRYAGFKALYPPGGGRSAVQVLAEDLDRLEEMEFLNDTIIDYYMRVLEEELRDQAGGERFYFFNSFFYKKLSEKTGARAGTQEHNALAYERVKKWTKGVDIFAKDFLFIPIHDALHWSLIIVCHPGQLARSSRAGMPQPAAAAGVRPKAGGAAAAASSPGQRKRTRGQEQQAPVTPPKEPSPADLLQSSSSSSEADVEVAEVGPGSDEEEVVQVHPAPAAAGRAEASGRGRGGSKAEALDMFTVPTACILHLDSMSDGHTTIPLCRDIRAYLEQEFLHKQAKSAEAEGEAEEDGNGSSRPQQQQQQSGEQQASLPQQWSQDHQGQRLKVTDKNLPHRKLHELPRQDNHCDCGLFVLTYTEYFTYAMLQREYSINVGHLQKNGHWAVKPQEAAAMDLPFPHFMRKRWFAPVIASHLRAFLQYRIFDLMLQQAPAELQDTEAYRDMQKQKQELEQLMNSQMGYTTRYLRPLDWAHNAEDIYAQMDKEEQERAERNRNQRAARAAARQQQQQAAQPEDLRTRCGAAAEKRAAAKKASRNLAQIAAEVGPDTEDAISSSSGGEGQEAPTRRRKKRRSQQLDTTDDEWRQSQQQQEEASQGSPVKRQRGSEAGFHMSAADFSDSPDEEEAIDVSTDTPDEPSPEAEPQEEAKRQAVLQDLYEHVGQAEAQALLRGHPLSPKRERGLRQVLSRHMELGVYGGLDSSMLVDALRNLVGDVPRRPGTRQKDGRKRTQQLEGGGGRHAAAAKRRKGSKQGQGTPAGPGPGQLSMHDFTRKQQQEEQQQEPACPYAEQQEGEGSDDLEQEDSMRILESASSGTSDEADGGQGPSSSNPAAAQQLYGSQGSQQQQPNGLTSPGMQVQVTHRTSQAAPKAELEMSLYDRLAEERRRGERMRAAAAAAMAAGAPAPLGPPPAAAAAGAAGAAVDRAAALARAEVRATPAVDLVSDDGLSDSADEAAAGNSTGVGAFASELQQYQEDRQDIFAGLPPLAAVAAAAGGAGQHQQHRNGLPHPQQPRIGRRRQATPQAGPAAAGNPFTGCSCGDASENPQQQGQQQQAPKQHVRRKQQQQQQQQQQVVEGQTAGAAAGPVPDLQHHNADQRRQERQAAQFGTHQGRSRKQPHVQPLLSPPKGSPQAPRGGARGQQAGYNPDGKQLFDEVREEVGAILGSAAGPSQGDEEDWVQLGDSDDDPERLPQQPPPQPQPQQQQRQPRQQQQQSAPGREWLQQGHPRPQQGAMPPANSAQALQLQQDEDPAAVAWAHEQALATRMREQQQAQQQAQVVPQLARRNPQWHPQRPAPTHAPSVGGGFHVPQAAPPGAVHAIAQQLLLQQAVWLTQAGSHPPPPPQQQQQHMQLPPAQRQQWRQSQTSTSVGEELVDLCND